MSQQLNMFQETLTNGDMTRGQIKKFFFQLHITQKHRKSEIHVSWTLYHEDPSNYIFAGQNISAPSSLYANLRKQKTAEHLTPIFSYFKAHIIPLSIPLNRQ
ncbi:unnamed protein product [Spodoptera littoralis]|uniref:Uncharacterized protein n=1 Tax=Spodoptera littoralis TaxID=7109 RepID=A0A9P0IFI9_SPOLI|nr:unnamed protein product [Spodoptera littoralis]CAH1644926.1 unnamed protein product [Spodoptera littoralis]